MKRKGWIMIDLTLSAFADEYSANFDDQLTICKELNVPNIELRFIDGKNVSTLTDEEVEETAKSTCRREAGSL